MKRVKIKKQKIRGGLVSKMMKRAIDKENKIIGNLKQQWERTTVSGQRNMKISAAEASGNVSTNT